MPSNNDIWSNNIHTVFTNVVEIFIGTKDTHEPINPSEVIRLNDSGSTLIVYDQELGANVTYDRAAFTINEPDRTSVNDETGSFSIAGVAADYLDLLNNATNDNPLIVRIGLVDYAKAQESAIDPTVEGVWVYDRLDYEVSSANISSATATVSLDFKSASGRLNYIASKLRYTGFEFPCLYS